MTMTMRRGVGQLMLCCVVALCVVGLVGSAVGQAACRASNLQNNCTACLLASTTDVKCGYCISFLSADFCYPLGENSIWPADGVTCYGEDMEWHWNSCPDPCLSQGDCEQCRFNFGAGCGYCMSSGQCMASSKKASCADWRDGYNDENACVEQLPCEQTAFCSTCVSNTKYPCQWCGGTEGNCIYKSQTCAANTTVSTNLNQCAAAAPARASGADALVSWLAHVLLFFL